MRLFITLLVAFITLPIITSAQMGGAFLVEPQLESMSFRHLPRYILQGSQFIPVQKRKGSKIDILYSADGPLELKVHYSIESKDGDGTFFQPLHSLKTILPGLQNAVVTVPINGSTAWSPGRNLYALQVLGQSGSNVTVHGYQFREGGFGDTLAAVITHLKVPEPLLLSTINFLHGYRILDVPFAMILNSILILFVAILLSYRGKQLLIFLIGCSLLLFVYDVRYSLDIVSVSAEDVYQWNNDREYRYLGAVHQVAETLKEEVIDRGEDLALIVCSDEENIYKKQLRYLLYPTRVESVGELEGDPTHMLIMASYSGKYEDGIVTCGEEYEGPASLLHQFSAETQLLSLPKE